MTKMVLIRIKIIQFYNNNIKLKTVIRIIYTADSKNIS